MNVERHIHFVPVDHLIPAFFNDLGIHGTDVDGLLFQVLHANPLHHAVALVVEGGDWASYEVRRGWNQFSQTMHGEQELWP